MIHGAKRGLTWDLAAAMRAITFFPVVLRLNGGQFEGRKFDLHPSQAFRIGSLFGWKQADGTRRFRRFYDEEGKGNGKSPLLAGIGLYCLLADGDHLPRFCVHGDYRRLVDNDAAAFDVDKRVGSAEVNADIVGKKPKKRFSPPPQGAHHIFHSIF